jgi:hypothetical protein
MSTVEIIASEVRELEPKQQSQVLRFLQVLRQEKEQNEEQAFRDFSLASAMRGMEDEPDLYSEKLATSTPLLRSRDWQGKKMGAKAVLSRDVIASAVRADRDAR